MKSNQSLSLPADNNDWFITDPEQECIREADFGDPFLTTIDHFDDPWAGGIQESGAAVDAAQSKTNVFTSIPHSSPSSGAGGLEEHRMHLSTDVIRDALLSDHLFDRDDQVPLIVAELAEGCKTLHNDLQQILCQRAIDFANSHCYSRLLSWADNSHLCNARNSIARLQRFVDEGESPCIVNPPSSNTCYGGC
eukprot:GHVT01058778.1.p2 GENE.GHVT01058778.1~~GHVT01058778.1.p2  ORF type:complete len:193 (-),score=14.60 GHVT01058778.1:2614-3192(-)